MTPKEKAKELVDQFDECLNNIMMGSNGLEIMLRERAIACALICCEQLMCQDTHNNHNLYWQQVKQEILKVS